MCACISTLCKDLGDGADCLLRRRAWKSWWSPSGPLQRLSAPIGCTLIGCGVKICVTDTALGRTAAAQPTTDAMLPVAAGFFLLGLLLVGFVRVHTDSHGSACPRSALLCRVSGLGVRVCQSPLVIFTGPAGLDLDKYSLAEFK